MISEQEQSEILNELELNSGSEEYHKIPFSNIKYTDGINDLINKCSCWWLISDTAIFMTSNKDNNILRGEEFLILKIEVTEDKKAIVTLKEDSDTPILYNKVYDYTDFPLKEFEFYIIGGIMLLKSEY